MAEDTSPGQSRFVRGNDHLDRLLSDPQLAADVAKAHEAAETDRAHTNEPRDDPQSRADDAG
ncbi:hypothetical protein FsymDg_0394 [Candidatus Protofrankia datiscae]|uniref:Uncharacterized protein n=1 Tax=Candidatus Protofrankia datiscae TaxID=2716812 RepID=F8B4L1_9ACTN|nr:MULTISPECIES: hypothetical protein [Protofrankia]AEH07954.1 hypothetical protein FsymDg_0394 [Candidatus Protofrankia datiscae]